MVWEIVKPAELVWQPRLKTDDTLTVHMLRANSSYLCEKQSTKNLRFFTNVVKTNQVQVCKQACSLNAVVIKAKGSFTLILLTLS